MKDYTVNKENNKERLFNNLVEKLWDYDSSNESISVMIHNDMYSMYMIIDRDIDLGEGIDIECYGNTLRVEKETIDEIIKVEDQYEGVSYDLILNNGSKVFFTFFKK